MHGQKKFNSPKNLPDRQQYANFRKSQKIARTAWWQSPITLLQGGMNWRMAGSWEHIAGEVSMAALWLPCLGMVSRRVKAPMTEARLPAATPVRHDFESQPGVVQPAQPDPCSSLNTGYVLNVWKFQYKIFLKKSKSHYPTVLILGLWGRKKESFLYTWSINLKNALSVPWKSIRDNFVVNDKVQNYCQFSCFLRYALLIKKFN